jgi:hypothetical protein
VMIFDNNPLGKPTITSHHEVKQVLNHNRWRSRFVFKLTVSRVSWNSSWPSYQIISRRKLCKLIWIHSFWYMGTPFICTLAIIRVMKHTNNVMINFKLSLLRKIFRSYFFIRWR